MTSRLRSWFLQLSTFYVAAILALYIVNFQFRELVRGQWLLFTFGLGILLAAAAISKPMGLKLFKEYPDPDEQETINNIINLLIRRLKKQYRYEVTLRDTHPKSNGLLLTEFEILPGLSEDLRVGLFAEPATYKCWLRFSNSDATVTPDAVKDFRGIALKLFPVPGDKLQEDEEGTLDFLLIGHDAFFAANPKDFLNFFVNVTHYPGRLGRLIYFIPKRLRLLRNSLVGRKSYGHPFEIVWFGCAPYRFGHKVVKYKLHSEWPRSEPDREDPDYLRQRLKATLNEQGHIMDFLIQFQEDPNRDLIESTGVAWRKSQWHKVATLHIPQQNFNSTERLEFDENLTYNPWHCPPAHRPVGGINRARRDVMRAIQEFRLDQNGQQRSKPNDLAP